jgi:uncharacterized membrane protein YhaH (DUF805 family)
MSFSDAVKAGFNNYTNFTGRASRPEFWWWVLFEIIVFVVAQFISAALDSAIFYFLVVLALFLPSLAVSIRRLHDTNRSGWWILISFVPLIGFIVLLIFYLQEGDAGPNDHGPPPVASPAAPPPAAPPAA